MNAIEFLDRTGFLRNCSYLIHDRDPVFTTRFTCILKDAGVKTVKLPASSPNLNAFAERFVGSIRRECLDHMIPLGEQHLRLIVREYVEHYNRERNGCGSFRAGARAGATMNGIIPQTYTERSLRVTTSGTRGILVREARGAILASRRRGQKMEQLQALGCRQRHSAQMEPHPNATIKASTTA